MKFDYAVIGAGVSGLATSLILAGSGLRVALIEKAERTAGTIRGFRRRGVQIDTGFHYAGGWGDGECLDLFCRFLGLADRIEKLPLAADGFDTVLCRRPACEFRFPCGPGRLRERLHETFPGERAAIDAYLQEMAQVNAAFPFINIEADWAGIGAADPRQGPTLQEVLDRLTGNRLLQGLLSVHTLLYGVPPPQAPFALHAIVAGPYYQSAHTLRGGGRSLAEAFDAELARRGVAVFCGDGAEALLLDGEGRPRGVRLAGGRTLACGGCVFTAHPKILLDLVPEGFLRPVYRKRLQGLNESPSACLLFGGTGELPAPLRGGNLFLLEEPEAAGRLEGENPDDGPLYVTAAGPAGENSSTAGFLAISPVSAGATAAWGDTGAGRRPPEYAAFKAEMVRKMRNRLAGFCPDLVRQIRWLEGATPLTLRDYGHSPHGSLYGVRHQAGQFNPHPQTRLPGLFLAGQAVAAPGVMGAMISAFLACGSIVGHERIQKELRACR